MRKICAMRNDQDLHQLFRARLPIATLPKEFADRLTKTVLDEVAHLRQAHALPQGCPDSYLEDSTPLPPLPKPPKSSPLPCATKTVAFLLLLNFLLWPFVQGCAFPTTVTAPQALPSTRLARIDSQLSTIRSDQTGSKQSSNHTAVTIVGAQNTGRALWLPPLLPLKPQLPIVQFQQRVFMSKSRLIRLATPNSAEALINLHGPPSMMQEISTTITLTVSYGSQNTSQDTPPATPPEPTPAATEQQPESTAAATATPTADILLLKPTVPASPPAPSPTPILSIFEPTTTPISTVEAPTGAATETPTAMPTICLQPWQTNEAEPTSVPTASPAPTTPEP